MYGCSTTSANGWSWRYRRPEIWATPRPRAAITAPTISASLKAETPAACVRTSPSRRPSPRLVTPNSLRPAGRTPLAGTGMAPGRAPISASRSTLAAGTWIAATRGAVSRSWPPETVARCDRMLLIEAGCAAKPSALESVPSSARRTVGSRSVATRWLATLATQRSRAAPSSFPTTSATAGSAMAKSGSGSARSSGRRRPSTRAY